MSFVGATNTVKEMSVKNEAIQREIYRNCGVPVPELVKIAGSDKNPVMGYEIDANPDTTMYCEDLKKIYNAKSRETRFIEDIQQITEKKGFDVTN